MYFGKMLYFVGGNTQMNRRRNRLRLDAFSPPIAHSSCNSNSDLVARRENNFVVKNNCSTPSFFCSSVHQFQYPYSPLRMKSSGGDASAQNYMYSTGYQQPTCRGYSTYFPRSQSKPTPYSLRKSWSGSRNKVKHQTHLPDRSYKRKQAVIETV